MQAYLDKLKEFVNKLNEKGIPLPLFRDHGTGSVSLTLLIVSFTMWMLSVVGKAAGFVGGINTSDCFNMVIAMSGLYFGRKVHKSSKGAVTLESKQESGQ